LAFQPDESIAQVLDVRDYQQAPYLVLATRDGMVKKTSLDEFDSNRSGGVIAINLRDDDELISAQLVNEDADVMLVSRKGMSVRFTADNETLRPMGRATSGVIGMRFREGDELLSMSSVSPGSYLVTVTDGGYAKRTLVDEWRQSGRGIYGVRAMKLVEERGSLVGALIAAEDDEVYAIASDGVVIRTRVAEIRATGRDTMGVALMDVGEDRAIVAVARGEASPEDEELDEVEGVSADSDSQEAAGELDSASPDDAIAPQDGVGDDSSDTVDDEPSESTDE
jgi:DNA gyrase subunit A